MTLTGLGGVQARPSLPAARRRRRKTPCGSSRMPRAFRRPLGLVARRKTKQEKKPTHPSSPSSAQLLPLSHGSLRTSALNLASLKKSWQGKFLRCVNTPSFLPSLPPAVKASSVRLTHGRARGTHELFSGGALINYRTACRRAEQASGLRRSVSS